MADDEDKTPSQLDKKKLLIRIRDRCKKMIDADEPNRREAKEDIKFVSVPGAQWDEKVKKARNGRPCYEFDKLSIKAQRVINEMRANRPAGKVRAVEDTDKATADVREGLCRNIANVSDLDTICDYAGVYQVEGGMGAWRVTTEYVPDTLKKQRIRAEPIPNPFSLYWDEASTDPLKRDAQDWCLIDSLSKTAYTQKYPKAQKVSFDAGECEADDAWDDRENIRVCEYWYKERYKKELWLLADGKTIDPAKEERRKPGSTAVLQVRDKGEVDCDRIMMCIASGDAILEGPLEQAGRNHRFIVVHGAWKIIDGKPCWWGLVRKAKDAQRSYNVERTAYVEDTASGPNSQFWATAEQAKGHTDTWDRAITENLPYLLYTPDPKAPGPPVRMQSTPVPTARVQAMMMADQELKDVTGVYDASLGERSNETSGVAIRNREQQTQLVNFNFPDNMAKGVQRTWEIFNDLIPEIIDTEQTVRVLGVDGAEDYVRVNTAGIHPETGEPIIVNDLTTGEFDITVTVGPSFATQRQEAAETYTEMAKADPLLMPTAGDLVYKSMDSPYADEIAERRRLMLPPPIQQHLAQGKKLPPEVQMAQAQVEQGMQAVQEHGKLVQAAQQELEQTKADAEKEQAQVQTAIEKLKTEEARFEAQVAKALAGLAQKEAQLAEREVQSQLIPHQQAIEAERGNLTNEAQQAVQTIQQLAEAFMQNAAGIVQQIDQRAAAPAQSGPRRRVARFRRVNGELTGSIDEVDDMGAVLSSQPASITRQNGELVGTLN